MKHFVKKYLPFVIPLYKKIYSSTIELKGNFPSTTSRRAQDASKFWQRKKEGDLIYEKSLSHHMGARDWEENKFVAYGDKHYSFYMAILRFAEMGKINPNILEWGPGGGANVLGFLKHFKTKYFGIDISKENLNECQKIAQKYKLNRFIPIFINIEEPNIVESIIDEKIDLFLMTYVIAHFPDKQYAEKIIRIAYQILANNGVAIFQVLLSDKTKKLYGDYIHNVHSNTVFNYEEFLVLCKKHGFIQILQTKDDTPNNQYFSYFVFKK